jgi:hypothetical protein
MDCTQCREYLHGYLDLNSMIPELVQYIEFQKGPYYAENGENSMREVCEAISLMLGQGGRTQSMTVEEAATEWGAGPANDTMGSNSRVRAKRARAELIWRPKARSLIEEIEHGCYS